MTTTIVAHSNTSRTTAQAIAVARPDGTSQRNRLGMLALVSATLLIVQTAMGHARAGESLADLAEAVSPAVVNITTSTVVEASTNIAPVVPEGSPFEDFFREFQDRNGDQGSRPRRSQALGSGFVISEDGYIVTNNHVIEGADEILIEFFAGGELPATLIGTDPNTDIALLKVTSDEPLDFVSFGDSDIARVGDWVMAVGNPLGQGFSVSAGIISARNRALSGIFDDYIQTDAAINRGNSGGPLFNMDGDVVGVNTAILSPNGGSIGIGFSMASNVVTRVVDQLQEFGETRRGWLGVRIQDVSEDVAEAIGLETASGALVTDVPDGPAKDAGVLAGDVIVSVDGADIEDVSGLVRQIGDSPVGAVSRVVVYRDGKTQTIKVTLGRRETAAGISEPSVDAPVEDVPEVPETADVLGMSLSKITDEDIETLGIAAGTDGLVIRTVDDMSEAYEKGLRENDVIVEAGQQKIETVSDLEARFEDAKDAGRRSILLLVRRDGNPRFVALTLE